MITMLRRLQSDRDRSFGCLLAMMASTRESEQRAQQADASSGSRIGRFEIAPRGYIQLDWRGYPEWDGCLPGLDVSPTTRWKSGAHASESMGA